MAEQVISGQAALDKLIALLDLEQIEEGIFRGTSPAESMQRVFGGQVAGQALVAAGRTVPADRPVHSLHAYFLRPGDPTVPIVYQVEAVRDGRSFLTRRVVAIQHGRPIFHLAASFHRREDGLDHQVSMPQVAPPESLPTLAELADRYGPRIGAFFTLPRPIDLRWASEPPWLVTEHGGREATQQVWMRADGVLPDDPLVHVCALTYASDMTLLNTALLPHGLSWEGVAGASLDHAMWFHRPFRADEWVLYDCDSPSASDSRGLAMGRMFSADGRLVATVVQEGLVRPVRRSPRHA